VVLDVSADGSTIVGTRDTADDPPQLEAFYWTQSEGLKTLARHFNPEDVNCDGTVVVGWQGGTVGAPTLKTPLRWTRAGVAPLPVPTGAEGRAAATTADGRFVVGQTELSPSDLQAPKPLFWSVTPTGTTLTQGTPRGAATHISATGDFTLGYLGDSWPQAAWCRWSGNACASLGFSPPTFVTHLSVRKT
jgi:uncharacterized membrane protein